MANNARDVALGSGSVTATAVATSSTTIDGVTYNFAGTTPTSTVSVGNLGSERTITNVAAGRISGSSTDAINGSQLFATNQSIENLSNVVEAGATHYYSVNDNGVQGGNYANDGATGLNALAAGVNATAAGDGGVAIGFGATAANAGGVALGSGSATAAAVATSSTTIDGVTYNFAGTTPNSTVSVGTVGGERTITNVAAGRISGSSTDAINGSQLFATNQAIEAVATTANAGWNISDGTNTGNIAPDETLTVTAGSNATVNYNDGTGTLTVGVVADPSFNSVTVGDTVINDGSISFISGGPSITNIGIDAGNTTITNVAPAVNGGDAVNLDQVTNLVDGVATHYYSVNDNGVQGGNYANDGATGLNALAAGVNATAAGDGGVAIGSGATAADAGGVALGSGSATAAAVATSSTTIDGVTYNFAGTTPTSTVSVGTVGGERTITNVAAGRISGSSTDAINGSQLFATNQSIENLSNVVEAGATHYYSVNDNGVQGGNYANDGATGLNALAAGVNATAAGDGGVAIGFGATAANAGGVALGSGSATAAAVATSSTTIDGVTYNFAGTTPNSTVSVGNLGSERTITNVAAGRISGSSTDAINGSQLFATNQSIENLSNEVEAGATHYYSVNDNGVQGGNYANDGATGLNALAAGVNASASGNLSVAVGFNSSAADQGAVAVGVNSDAAAGWTTAVGDTATASGQFATAVGNNAQAGDQFSSAFGTNANASGRAATAIGPNAGASGVSAVAVGDTSQASGASSAAFGGGANASALGALALGPASAASGRSAVALGDSSAASGQYASALGAGSIASAPQGVALGSFSVANTAAGAAGYDPVTGLPSTDTSSTWVSRLGAVSVGSSGQTRQITNVAAGSTDTDAVNVAQLRALSQEVTAGQTHYYSVNDGGVQGGNYANDGATGLNSLAAGVNATAGGAGSVAIGSGATAADANSVALGAGSATTAAVGTANTTIDGVTYNFAGTTPTGTVSVGSLGAERTITNVAAGRISGSSTDAINGSQLFATNQSIENLSNVVEAGATHYYSVNDGGVQGGNYANDGATGLNSLAAGVNAAAGGAGSVAIGFGATAADANSVALGSNASTAVAVGTSSVVIAGTSYNFAGTTPIGTVSVGSLGAERTITNVAAGRISGSSTDAINGSQLFATNQSIENLSNEVDASATHYYSVNDGGVQGGNHANDGATGLNALAAGVNAAAGGDSAVAIGFNATATDANSVALGSNASTAAAVGTAGVVIGGTSYSFAGTAPVGTVSVGSLGAERTITNVAAGRISGTSTDAINGSQLYATNQAIANLSNVVNASTAHYYSVNDGGTHGGNYNNDGASGVNSVAAGVNASASGQGGVAVGVNSNAAGTGSVAVGSGSQSTVAGGVALGANSVSNTAAGVAGYVPPGATAGQTAAIAATTSTAGAVSVGDASNGLYRQITGVAAGTAPSDAVNVAQLQAVQNHVNATATHYYSVNDGGVQGGNYANNGATGNNAMAGGVNSSASGNNSVAIGANTSATANNSAALGAGSTATHVNSVAVGNGSATTVGAQSNYNAAYVGNSTSTGEMNIGGRTITGVAPGIAGTDAVNVNQLSSGVNYAINQANQYTDARLAQLDNDVWTMERGYRGATSSAMAMAGLPQAYLPGKSMLAVGFGGYQGEYGMALGLSGITDNGRFVYKAQASGNTTRDWGFSVGAGIQW
ncbi:YadA-like family protein [Lysobacter sp. Root96]|uniref:YadA-like family protein n=1 Tax=Lysobacter sp. Root96 TaxID=1736612 RepID=UPI0006FF4367|nr:YadA-like family protein [Lysobacter sp. Root96]KRD65407.1 hypothetical protein ASE45_18565 [Lysobacter sp. Root96]